MLSTPQLCIAATYPQNPVEDPLTVQAMTIPDQIQATHDTYGRQMDPPSGKPLFHGTLYHNATDSTGVTLHPHRHFTAAHLLEYYPLSDIFDDYTKQ